MMGSMAMFLPCSVFLVLSYTNNNVHTLSYQILPEVIIQIFKQVGIPYSRLILRGENFEVFTDFALSLKFQPQNFSDILLKKL